ncbi:TPA: hypothetical protein N2907_001684 [Vibrio parahaemolyticus]|nr:hypothetical protein D5E79_08525 [Vibrio parahaemolyticus]HCH1566060.1 hypothetical protein [Vibrio parahaemolyticus]HCH2585475.1 hypothetical protein [Vibrio parahaemolyticus]HCM1319405.1 hypothetical protein [Vibrio parahaemolyticus]
MSDLHNLTSITERIISRREFRNLTGISRTTEWRLAQKGKLPTSIVIDNVVLGYRESSYLTWLDSNSSLPIAA